MKREQSDEGGEKTAGNKRNRRNDDIVRLLIPSRIAGAVIGKGGQHIQKMRSQFKATVSVDDCQGPERTILISSDLESVLSIIKEMLKYFEEKDNEVDVRMLIHQSLAGCVIGKGGAKIKEIRDKIGCRILKVFSNVAPQSTDRIVQVIGKQEQCVEAVREVLDVTRDTPIKGSVHNYDPINFDDLYADEYGGYGGMQNGGGGGGMGGGMRGGDRQSRFDRRGDNPRRFGGNQGDRNRRDDRSRSDGRRDREYINPWANDGPISSGMGNMGGTSFGGNMGGGFSGNGGFGGNSGNGFNSGTGGGFNSGSGSGFGGSSGGGFGSANSGFGGSGSFGSGPAGNFVGTGGFGGASGMAGGGSLGNGIGGTGLGGGSVGTGNMNNSAGGGFSSGMNNGGPVNVDDKNSTQVTIPKDLAGAIIGKGGGRIRRIRNESGAYITIDEPLPGSNDRIITISGNPKQIQMAQYLLQQSVHENRRKF